MPHVVAHREVTDGREGFCHGCGVLLEVAIEPVELECEGVEGGFWAELDFAHFGFANRSVIPRAEDEPLLSAGFWVARLLLHDAEVVG